MIMLHGLLLYVSCLAQILGCLAVVTFFGASNSDETESVMKLLWDLINPGTDSSV